MKKILITGSNGFIGTNIYDTFHDDIELFGLDISKRSKFPKNQLFNWEELDKIPPVDMIIHLAGKAHDTKNQSEASSYFEVNTGLTKNIYDWFLLSKAKKFIFFSSVKAATDTVIGEILTEDVIPTPKGPYGESKRAAEMYILDELEKLNASEGARGEKGESVMEREKKDGIEKGHFDKKVYILRPCMIHGSGNKGNMNLLYKIVKKAIPWPLGAFDNQRSFCSIDNLNFVIRNLIEKDIESGIYQIADDQPLSTNELIRLIAESLDKKTRIWNINKTFIRSLARLGNIFHLPLNNERLKKLTESYVVSNQKIKKAMGIEKMPVSAEEGFKKTFKSFQK